MLNDTTKVTFKNVPMYVPDEEILHLCGIYGAVLENKVHREQLRISTSTKKGVLQSSTRYVFMHLKNGASFNNYYWMEGPMSSDPGRRITVLHHGQTQQCSNCFLTASSGCKGAGNGKLCFKAEVPRAKMSTYMQHLRITTGYESLKTKYMRQLASKYPNSHVGTPTDTIDQEVSDMNDEESCIEDSILPINPIVEKDREIAHLRKTVDEMKSKLATISVIQKELEEAKNENRRIIAISKQAGRRLSVNRRANEQKMVSLIQTGVNWSEDSAHLACSHAAVLNENDFELDSSFEKVKPKDGKEHFLKKVEENLDQNESLQIERFQEMERLILEQMKTTLKDKKIRMVD